MAENVVNEEFWLPADFLDDEDDYLLEEPTENRKVSEPESDEEEFVAGLTRQMARSFLQGEDKNPKAMATSPQSTLRGLGSWSFSSNDGSPEGPASQVSSPPSTPFDRTRDDALDLLYEAAGQVVRLGLNDERGILGPPGKPNRHNLNPPNPTPSLIQQQLQAAQFYQLKREQIMKQQFTAAWRRQNAPRSSVGVGRPMVLSPSAWPPLQATRQQQQQQNMPGAGMRAVFLNGSSTRRESAGTGVFLPRRAGTTTESRKKPACSTVLLPARVVQALNLNLDEVGVYPRFSGGQFDQDGQIARNNVVHTQTRRDLVYNQPTATATGPEIQLPQEWTY